MVRKGGGLTAQQATEYDKWRQSPERRAMDEAAERKRAAEAARTVAGWPKGALHQDKNSVTALLLQRRFDRNYLHGFLAPFEAERDKIRGELRIAREAAVAAVEAEFHQRLSEVGLREAAALAAIGED